MNCDRFEMMVRELSGVQPLAAEDHEAALEHAAACSRCCNRLGEARALSAALRALAGRKACSPDRVERALRSAYRDDVAVLARAAARARRIRILARIAAAVVLPMPLFMWFVTGFRTSVEVRQASRPAPEISAAATQQATATGAFGNSRPRDLERREQPRKLQPRPSVEAPREIATRFFPLTHGADLSQLESGQIVRVRMPRITLASFGLPVNFERSGEPVSADVVVGFDGIAHAIRFVQ